jgi:peptidoglycan hydrolase-like protein with peptidoglycan-binding domain
MNCRGIFVQEIQKRLNIRADGAYGPATREAVAAAQRSFGIKETGEADVATHAALHIKWPSQFERCLNITQAMEGTYYGDLNRTDIDRAGVTLGILGFTTEHGEVQAIGRTYLKDNPDAWDVLNDRLRGIFRALVAPNSTAGQWERAFYGDDGIIDSDIAAVVKVWGEDPAFKALQRKVARDNFWMKAVKDARALGLETMAGYGLMFDIAVQNGGWGQRHLTHYNKQSQDGTQESRLRAIARAVADAADPKWRADALSRKMVFANTAGKVHGSNFDLDNYAFEL